MAFVHDNIIIQASDVTAGAAGTTDITSAPVDASNCDGVLFIVSFGAITAGATTSIYAEECATSGGSYKTLDGTTIEVADDDDDKTFYIDIQRPKEKFLHLVVDRGDEDAVVGSIIAIKYGCAIRPVAQGAGVESGVAVITPDEESA